MTDILTRLRSWVKSEVQEPDPASVILAAADEIERLRRLVPPIAGTVDSETGMGFVPWSVAASVCQAADVSRRVAIVPQGFKMRRLSPWIHVGEGLPPLMTEVLGWHKDDRVRAWFRHSGQPIDAPYWELWSPQDRECDDCDVEEPTHWMPMPEPPEV